MDHRCL